MNWNEQITSTHQDHVIAHVIGATVLGYFVFEESIYLLLDIGFFWRVYLDAEMGLLPYSVMIDELEADSEAKAGLKMDSERLLTHGSVETLKQLATPPCHCLIKEVTFYRSDQDWKLVILGEPETLDIQTSLAMRDFIVTCSRD